jgi:hypothetical protein
MAFIRKRGRSYYLVHNIRKNGQVQQLYLACLGRRPRLSDEIIQGITSKHPFVRIDWDSLREKASRALTEPLQRNSQQVQELLQNIRSLNLDIADLHLPWLEMAEDRELALDVVSGLKLLRTTLDVKLSQIKKGKLLPTIGTRR